MEDCVGVGASLFDVRQILLLLDGPGISVIAGPFSRSKAAIRPKHLGTKLAPIYLRALIDFAVSVRSFRRNMRVQRAPWTTLLVHVPIANTTPYRSPELFSNPPGMWL